MARTIMHYAATPHYSSEKSPEPENLACSAEAGSYGQLQLTGCRTAKTPSDNCLVTP